MDAVINRFSCFIDINQLSTHLLKLKSEHLQIAIKCNLTFIEIEM